MMRILGKAFSRDGGTSTIEYAIIISAVAITLLGGMYYLSDSAFGVFSRVVGEQSVTGS